MVVVEAARTGGAPITAVKAAEYGIPVFAMPGDVDQKSSEGCNLLIRDGAFPVLDPRTWSKSSGWFTNSSCQLSRSFEPLWTAIAKCVRAWGGPCSAHTSGVVTRSMELVRNGSCESLTLITDRATMCR